VCLATPEPFEAVGAHYVDFRQVDDDEVLAALAWARRPEPCADDGGSG
jgi:putative phosphoribosyl transferase